MYVRSPLALRRALQRVFDAALAVRRLNHEGDAQRRDPDAGRSARERRRATHLRGLLAQNATLPTAIELRAVRAECQRNAGGVSGPGPSPARCIEIAIVALMLAGCTTQGVNDTTVADAEAASEWIRKTTNPSPDDAYTETRVTFDRFTGITSVISQTLRMDCTSRRCIEVFLLAALRRGNEADNHLLVIAGTYTHRSDWHFFDRALLPGGKTLPFVRNAQDADCHSDGCSLTESFSILIPVQDARERPQGGFEFSVRGSGGEVEFAVPPGLIDGFLRRVDQERERLLLDAK